MSVRRAVKRRARAVLALLISALTALALACLSPALADASPTAHWTLESRLAPSNLPPGGEGEIVLVAANLGDAEINGDAEEIAITDELPPGLEATAIKTRIVGPPEVLGSNPGTCTKPSVRPLVCKFKTKVQSFWQLEAYVKVKATVETPTRLENEMSVKGGGLAEDTHSETFNISEEPVAFGVERFEVVPENEDGSRDTQAGSHPFQLTTTFNLNESFVSDEANGSYGPGTPALQRELAVQLPPGLVGNAQVTPQCSGTIFGQLPGGEARNNCPADTAVGVATVWVNLPTLPGRTALVVPIFNLVPPSGEPAQFGFYVTKVPVVLNTSLRTGGDYGVTVTVRNTPETVDLVASRVTFWGVPGSAAHDAARGWACLGFSAPGTCEPHYEATNPSPLLTLPTSCQGRPTATVSGDSWPLEGTVSRFGPPEAADTYTFPEFTGCPLLPEFKPTFELEPETQKANTPTGLTVKVHVPQETTKAPYELAESAVKDTTVEFPEGLLLNPSAANGLEACPLGETGIGFTGQHELDEEPTNTFTEKLPEPLEPGKNFCPNASKIGVVRISTPDLPNELEGGVYLAEQNANPFGSLFAMYIVAQDPVSKVLIKLAGEVSINPDSGRITSSFLDTPDAPFEELTLKLFGGERASLTTPPTCGSYETHASLTPWSGTGPVESSSSFTIDEGAGGSGAAGCASTKSALPFSPSFAAGSTNTQAAAFTNFTLNIAHADADQPLSGIEMKLPGGVAGLLSSVTLCPEPQAAQGTCGPESQIGEATATAGLGNEPFTETGGKVYITGPYDGAPFGLTVVVPTQAGPFNFGDVVTRSTINVNPTTAALTIDSPLPTMVDTNEYPGGTGVPVQLKAIHVEVNRPGFEFNPTDCEPMSISSKLEGEDGASKEISYPFQVTGCASLPFAPKLTASVLGQASKADGAQFAVKVESPGLGQANIHKVDLTLPEALPSRLSTIEKACPVAVFDANPASCDEGSVIGYAVVHTPVLKSVLTGPAYLVSHAAAEFPDVEFVLQGEGITLVLDGKTDIKHGITYSKFESAPDAPFTVFETVFPAGPHSALTAYVPESENYNLCKHTLTIPTEITGQNGAFISQTTPVEVTGCGEVLHKKEVKLTRAQKLEKALKECRTKYKKKKQKSKLVACEKQARKKYGPAKAKKTARKSSKQKAKEK